MLKHNFIPLQDVKIKDKGKTPIINISAIQRKVNRPLKDYESHLKKRANRLIGLKNGSIKHTEKTQQHIFYLTKEVSLLHSFYEVFTQIEREYRELIFYIHERSLLLNDAYKSASEGEGRYLNLLIKILQESEDRNILFYSIKNGKLWN